MNKTLHEFTCDKCGQLIKDPSDGWVEWEKSHVGKLPTCYGFKIVHHETHSPLETQNGCYHYQSKGLPLADFLGLDHMHQILSFLDNGPIHTPAYSGPNVSDLREYTEFVRRLTIPYYEEARKYWSQAKSDGYFHGQNEIKLYQPENLKGIIDKYG